MTNIRKLEEFVEIILHIVIISDPQLKDRAWYQSLCTKTYIIQQIIIWGNIETFFCPFLSKTIKSILFYDHLKSTYLSQSAWCLVRIPQWFSLYTWLYKNLLTVTNEGSGTETSCWEQLSLSTCHWLHQSAYIHKHCWTWGLILNLLLHLFVFMVEMFKVQISSVNSV